MMGMGIELRSVRFGVSWESFVLMGTVIGFRSQDSGFSFSVVPSVDRRDGRGF